MVYIKLYNKVQDGYEYNNLSKLKQMYSFIPNKMFERIDEDNNHKITDFHLFIMDIVYENESNSKTNTDFFGVLINLIYSGKLSTDNKSLNALIKAHLDDIESAVDEINVYNKDDKEKEEK